MLFEMKMVKTLPFSFTRLSLVPRNEQIGIICGNQNSKIWFTLIESVTELIFNDLYSRKLKKTLGFVCTGSEWMYKIVKDF